NAAAQAPRHIDLPIICSNLLLMRPTAILPAAPATSPAAGYSFPVAIHPSRRCPWQAAELPLGPTRFARRAHRSRRRQQFVLPRHYWPTAARSTRAGAGEYRLVRLQSALTQPGLRPARPSTTVVVPHLATLATQIRSVPWISDERSQSMPL